MRSGYKVIKIIKNKIAEYNFPTQMFILKEVSYSIIQDSLLKNYMKGNNKGMRNSTAVYSLVNSINNLLLEGDFLYNLTFISVPVSVEFFPLLDEAVKKDVEVVSDVEFQYHS